MHEMSVALEVCDIAQRAIGDRSPRSIREVVVVVGEESGLEPDNLSFCLTAVLGAPPFAGARAVLRRVAGDILTVAHVDVEEPCPS